MDAHKIVVADMQESTVIFHSQIRNILLKKELDSIRFARPTLTSVSLLRYNRQRFL